MTEIISRAVSPLTFVILARFLTPQDYGVLAVAQIAISFCYLFWDAGLQKALIQTSEPLEKAANVIFWVNLALSLVIYAVLFSFAPLLADFFNSPESRSVLRILGLQIVIGALTTVQQGLLLKSLDFKKLFWAKLLIVGTPACISIPLAYLGYGYWALVASYLAGSLINLVYLWAKSHWRPQLHFDPATARKLMKFGFWIVLDSFIGWLISQGDSVVIGRFLGVRDLGLYRTGRNIIDIVFGFALNPINPILFPAFSALKENKTALIDYLFKANRLIMALSLPIGLGLMCLATPMSAVIFGEKWKGIEAVIRILSLQTALGWLVGANPEVYRAVGRPDCQTKIGFFSIPLYLFVYFLVAPYGLNAFVYARLGLSLVSLPIHIYFAVNLLNVSCFYLWETGKYIVIATSFMVITIIGMEVFIRTSFPNLSPTVSLAIIILIGIFSYIGSLWLLDKSFVLQIFRTGRKVVAS